MEKKRSVMKRYFASKQNELKIKHEEKAHSCLSEYFTWVLNDGETGSTQTGYLIRISTTLGLSDFHQPPKLFLMVASHIEK